MLSSNQEDSYDAYISVYAISQQDLDSLLVGRAVDLEGKTALLRIEDDHQLVDEVLLGKEIYIEYLCPEVTVIPGNDCGCQGHHTLADILNGVYCHCFFEGGITLTPDQSILSWGYCSDTIGGGDGSSGGDGSGSGDGDDDMPDPPIDSHGNGSGVITTPVPCSKCPELESVWEEKGPCGELNKLVQNPHNNPNPFVTGDHRYPRTAILNMGDFLNSNLEQGYGLYNAGNVPQYGPYAHHIENTEPQHIFFPVVATQFGTIHIHQIGEGYPMFSHDDIYSLLHIRDTYALDNLNPSGDDLFVAILTVKQGSDNHTYAIKIEDINRLNALETLHQNEEKWGVLREIMRSLYEDKANGMNGTPTQYQRAFLEFVNEFNESNGLGVSLYEMEVDNPGTPNIAMNWSKLSLSENGDDVIKTPCD